MPVLGHTKRPSPFMTARSAVVNERNSLSLSPPWRRGQGVVTTSRLHFLCRCGIIIPGGKCAQTLNKIKIRRTKTGMKSQTIARFSYCILERLCGGKVYKSRYHDIAYATMMFHRYVEKGFCESVSVILVESPHVLSDEQTFRLVMTWPNQESSAYASLVKRGGIF